MGVRQDDAFINAGDLDRLMTLYTEDAVDMPPGISTLEGAEAIAADLEYVFWGICIGQADAGIQKLVYLRRYQTAPIQNRTFSFQPHSDQYSFLGNMTPITKREETFMVLLPYYGPLIAVCHFSLPLVQFLPETK